MASYTITLTTDHTSFITTITPEVEVFDDHHLAMMAVSAIYENEGIDLSLRRWSVEVEALDDTL
jgi:hypothetical protein